MANAARSFGGSAWQGSAAPSSATIRHTHLSSSCMRLDLCNFHLCELPRTAHFEHQHAHNECALTCFLFDPPPSPERIPCNGTISLF